MQRIMIIGCCGAGKSTLARQYHAITDLPLIHLDQCYWRPGWEETPDEEWEQTVTGLAAGDRWIIDGNYGSSLDIRLARTEMVVFLDFPTWRCVWRVLRRIVRHWGRERPDMPRGCRERFDWSFLHYVATFNLTRRPTVLKKLAALPEARTVVTLRNQRAVRAFLRESREKWVGTTQ